MAVDNEKLAKSRPGSTAETNPDQSRRPAGLYRHEESGNEAIVQNDPLYGDAQAAAFERVGFVFVREVEPGEIKTIASASDSHAASPDRQTDAQVSYNKGLEARLNALEAENSRLREQATPTPGASPEADASGEAAKEAGTTKVEQTTGTKVDSKTGDVQEPVTGEEGPKEGEGDELKPLYRQNRSELEETATAEGLTDLAQYETKANLVDAIVASRKAKTEKGEN